MMPDYTDKQKKEAAQELNALTPEGYLDLLETLRRYEKGLPEAPAKLSFSQYDQFGVRVTFTMVDSDEYALINRYIPFGELLDGMDFRSTLAESMPQSEVARAETGDAKQEKAAEKKSGTKEVRTSGENADVSGADVDRFEVEEVRHLVTNKGKHYLLVKGGPWMQYGWKAWPEMLPESVDLDKLEVGKSFKPSSDILVAYADKEKRKIIAFATLSA